MTKTVMVRHLTRICVINTPELIYRQRSNSFVMAEGQKSEKKPDLGLLEEDDEFEEFPAEDWTGQEEDEGDQNVWEDNWDDDDVEDDFSKQLRAELEKQGHKMADK